MKDVPGLEEKTRKWWHNVSQAYFNYTNRNRKWPYSKELFEAVDKYYFDFYALQNTRLHITEKYMDKE